MAEVNPLMSNEGSGCPEVATSKEAVILVEKKRIYKLHGLGV